MKTAFENLTFELEIVTPLFLGGADGNTPELRAPSFKGAMRWWFRAMMGSIIDYDMGKLKKLEEKVFGSTSYAGEIALQLRSNEIKATNWVPAKDKFGMNYLFFSLRGTQSRSPRKFIDPGQKLELVMNTRKTSADRCLKVAVGSLWLLVNLGGLGSRSRRGAGSLKTVSTDTKDFNFTTPDVNPSGLAIFLEEGIKTTKRVFEEYSGKQSSPPISTPPYTSFSKLTKLWVFDKIWPSSEGALHEIGTVLASYRREKNRGRTGNLLKGVPVEFKSAAFGLPIQFYFPRSRKGATLSWEMENNKVSGRRASPLIIKVHKLAQQKYGVSLLLLLAEFLPNGESLRFSENPKQTFPVPQFDVKDFKEHFENESKHKLIEVSYE